jgi:hypothetical protein
MNLFSSIHNFSRQKGELDGGANGSEKFLRAAETKLMAAQGQKVHRNLSHSICWRQAVMRVCPSMRVRRD